MTRQFKHRECTQCHDRPAQRSSVLCARCASGETDEPWTYPMALSLLVILAERVGNSSERSAAEVVRLHHQREQSKAKHPSGRGQ